MKVLVYRITVPWHYGYSTIRDMLRYSGCRPSKVESWIQAKPKNIIFRHPIRHGDRSRDFFHKQIERRWDSFGCIVQIIGEEDAESEDRQYRYNVVETENLMKRLVLESRRIGDLSTYLPITEAALADIDLG